jgi:hypothetical protein
MTPRKEKPASLQPVQNGAEVRAQLGRILGSTVFRGSKRCQDFLQFVVERALEGDADSLKERTLAVEVFGRGVGADLADDSIVRVGAREVRKRLAQYYVTDGAHDPLRIDLPAGSYVPTFQPPPQPEAAPPAAAPEVAAPSKSVAPAPAPPLARGPAASAPPPAAPPPPAPSPEVAPPAITSPPFEPPVVAVPPVTAEPRPSQHAPVWVLAAALILLAIVPVIAWQWNHSGPREFDAFWRPAFDQSGPLLLAMAHPLVYHPSTKANRLNEERNGVSALPVQMPVNVPPELLNGSDFVPVTDQYVGFGDTAAAVRLAGLFAKHSHAVRVRLANKVDFADMRDAATVLIGAFTNRWAVEITQKFRYHFSLVDGNKPSIVDSSTGQRRWSLDDKTDNGRANEDYILICRLPHSESGGFVILGAGLTQYGTGEAGRILSDPAALSGLLKQLPANWESQNMELVLHSKIVGDTPTPPELIGRHVW